MPPFKPLRTEKFYAEVADQIKKSIFDGTYGPGDRLPSESDMANLFGVSKVTVRQAIRVLENAGLVFTKQGMGGGIFLSEADTMAVSTYLSDMLKLKRVTQSDLTMARLIFEPDVAALVCGVWEEGDLQELEKNILQAWDAFKKGDLAGTRILSLAFHRLLCSISKNPVIMFTLNSVIDVLEENVIKIALDQEFVRNEIVAHELILERIRARREDEAREEMRGHIRVVHEKLEVMYQSLKA